MKSWKSLTSNSSVEYRSQNYSDFSDFAYQKDMAQFNGQKLDFKFGLADNSDFAEVPNIYLPYLYRTYVALVNSNPRGGVNMGVIMQCLLYDNLGDVIKG